MDDVERDILLREAVALLKAAASTADPQKAEELRERAHVLFVLHPRTVGVHLNRSRQCGRPITGNASRAWHMPEQ
jgi:hypothetical protein